MLATYFFIFLNVMAVSTAQILIKIGTSDFDISDQSSISSLINVYIFISIVLSVIAILSWFVVVSKLSLSYAYPLVSLTFPIVLLLSSVILNEQISSVQWIGVIMLVFSLCLLTYR